MPICWLFSKPRDGAVMSWRRFAAFGVAALALAWGGPATAQDLIYPKDFRARQIATNGTQLHVRVGGTGPAVVLLHGYGETGDMWVPLAKDLARDHTVVVPDLRGMGLSAIPPGGYDKKTQARDIAGVLDALKIDRAALVAHDIGNMVGYAFAASYRQRVTRFVLIDAPLPGVGPWEDILKNPLLWHFRFGGPDMERLVKDRERIYLDRFWNEFSATPARFSEAARRHYSRLYARPGAMRAGFAQFAAFDQDAIDNKVFVTEGKLAVPVLALGGEIVWNDDGCGHAVCRERRRGGRHSGCRSLGHGREPEGDSGKGTDVSRQGPLRQRVKRRRTMESASLSLRVGALAYPRTMHICGPQH